MTKETISIIRRWIKENPTLNNSQLANLIFDNSTLNYSEGSLKNYIAQVKKLDSKIVSTSVGHINDDIKKDKSPKTEKPVETVKKKSIHEHIKGYLVAFPDVSFSELARMMHDNNIGKDFSEGTLRNYISRNAKEIKFSIGDEKVNSSEELYNKVKDNSKEEIPFEKLHIVNVVDQGLNGIDYLNQYFSYFRSLCDYTTNTVCEFSENVSIKKFLDTASHIEFNYQPTLGISLFNAINTTLISLVPRINKEKEYVVINIITSGYDNMSTYLTSDNVRNLITRVSTELGWTINLIYLQNNSEEAKKLGQQLGIDSSNILVTENDGYIVKERLISSFNKKLNTLRNKSTFNLESFV